MHREVTTPVWTKRHSLTERTARLDKRADAHYTQSVRYCSFVFPEFVE